MNKLGIRRHLLLVVVLGIGSTVAALVIGFNLILGRTLDRDARDLVRSRAAAQVALLHLNRGHLTLGDAPGGASAGATTWVFADRRTLERPHLGASVDAVARSLAVGPARFLDAPDADLRLYSDPILVDNRRVGTVVAGVSLAPYEQTRRAALSESLVLGFAVLALVFVAARWLLASALRPVQRMTRQAAAWSERDLDQRFALGEPNDELTELAATLDQLLDRLAASLRHEQRFSAELSHELKTPLARVMAESELALRRPRTEAEYRHALELVNRNARHLTRTVDALVAAAQHEAGVARGTSDAYTVASDTATACAELAHARNVELNVQPPKAAIRIGVDSDLAERILQPLLENACRYGDGEVTISISQTGPLVSYTIEDNGPGVPDHEREQIFDPGARGAQGIGRTTGAGLGLSLARRLARAANGEIQALPCTTGGRFLVTLPKG